MTLRTPRLSRHRRFAYVAATVCVFLTSMTSGCAREESQSGADGSGQIIRLAPDRLWDSVFANTAEGGGTGRCVEGQNSTAYVIGQPATAAEAPSNVKCQVDDGLPADVWVLASAVLCVNDVSLTECANGVEPRIQASAEGDEIPLPTVQRRVSEPFETAIPESLGGTGVADEFRSVEYWVRKPDDSSDLAIVAVLGDVKWETAVVVSAES